MNLPVPAGGENEVDTGNDSISVDSASRSDHDLHGFISDFFLSNICEACFQCLTA